jgi:Trk K+ transport system NAD-binding subunit
MHVILLIIFICVIYVIVIMGGLALQFTGVEKARAQFQSLSAFSGTGFTTKEAETVVNHPRRRKIIMALMILGNAGIVSVIATFASSLRKTNVTELAINLGVIAVSIFLLHRIATYHRFARRLRRRLGKMVRRMFHLDQVHVDEVLEQGDGYGVMRVLMGAECEATGKDLMHSGLSRHEILVLCIERDQGNIPFPKADNTIRAGDRLVCYGKMENMRHFFYGDGEKSQKGVDA